MSTKKNYTLFDNHNYDTDAYRADYKEWCEENEVIDTDQGFYDWFGDQQELEWDDFNSNLSYSKYNDCECVIIGSVGRWNGNFTIEPMKCKTLTQAIHKCLGSCDYLIVNKVNGHLEVTSIHHDGGNSFEIHLLNDRGINAGENANLANKRYHKAIREQYLF